MYLPSLLERPAVVVANKVDLLDERAFVAAIAALEQWTSLPIIAVSAQEHRGIPALKEVLMQLDSQHASCDIALADACCAARGILGQTIDASSIS